MKIFKHLFLVGVCYLGSAALGQGASFTFTSFSVPGADITSAYGMNDIGQIVGF